MRLSHTKLSMIMTTKNFPLEELSTHSWPVTMLSFSCWAPQITRGKCYRVKSCVWAQQSTSLVQRIYSVYLSKMDKNKPRNPPPAAGMLNEYTYFCPVGIKIEPCLDLVCRRAVRISDFHWTIIINISFFKYYRYQYRCNSSGLWYGIRTIWTSAQAAALWWSEAVPLLILTENHFLFPS